MFPQPGAVPSNFAAKMRGFAEMLMETERLPRQDLRDYQTRRVSELFRHARRTTKHYRDRLDFDVASPASIEASWAKIPILTRAEAIKNSLKLMSRKTPAHLGSTVAGETSGSTGMPFAFKASSLSALVGMALSERKRRWWSMDGTKSLAAIKKANAPAPEGVTGRGWHWNHPDGISHVIGIEADVDTYLDWLMARRPDYLLSYSTILKALAQAAQRRRLELKFDLLLSFAEVVDEETRDICRVVFGAEIADTYSAQEIGHMAAQCPQCGEYHVSAEAAVVEVLDDEGKEVAPGEIGHVVVTPFYNYAMPLIRYELGDMAEVGSPRPACGRSLPTLRRILGRRRNMFKFRDGTTTWPVTSKFELTRFIMLKQFQIVQKDFDTIEIRYLADEPEAPIDMAALTERMRTVLRQPVEVVIRRVDRISRTSSGKYEDCISLVTADGVNAKPASRAAPGG